ncbi:15957_t:CDS:2, partial [Acaulospora colombiana]
MAIYPLLDQTRSIIANWSVVVPVTSVDWVDLSAGREEYGNDDNRNDYNNNNDHQGGGYGGNNHNNQGGGGLLGTLSGVLGNKNDHQQQGYNPQNDNRHGGGYDNNNNQGGGYGGNNNHGNPSGGGGLLGTLTSALGKNDHQQQGHSSQNNNNHSGGSGGLMGMVNNALGGGQRAEEKEAIDMFQEHVMKSGPQNNESAIEQAKDKQIADAIRGGYKQFTGKDTFRHTCYLNKHGYRSRIEHVGTRESPNPAATWQQSNLEAVLRDISDDCRISGHCYMSYPFT